MDNKNPAAQKAQATKAAETKGKPQAAEAKPEKPTHEAFDAAKAGRYTYRGKEFVDLRGVDGVCGERKAGAESEHKYAKVHKAAVEAGSPCKLNWKYATTIFTAKKSAPEKKEGTAYGIIQRIVKQAGDNGISGMELVPLVRAAARGNSRTNFGAGQIPPIGWAEGWIDTAVGSLIVDSKRRLELEDVEAAQKAESNIDEKKVANA